MNLFQLCFSEIHVKQIRVSKVHNLFHSAQLLVILKRQDCGLFLIVFKIYVYMFVHLVLSTFWQWGSAIPQRSAKSIATSIHQTVRQP